MADLGAFASAAARAAREGLSANKAYKLMQEAGLGIRRATFLKAYAELKAAVQADYSLLGLPLAGRPGPEMVHTIANARRDGFHHQVNMLYRDRLTGDVVQRRVTVVSEGLLTREQAEEGAMRLHVEGEYQPDAVLLGISLESVRRYSTGV